MNNFITTILIIILLAGCGSIGYSLYYWENKDTDTVITGNLNALEFAEGTVFPFELNMYDNVFEFRANYYTDVRIPTEPEDYKFYYSSGVQFYGTPKFEYTKLKDLSFKNGRYEERWGYKITSDDYYYNTSAGISFSKTNKLSPNDSWIIDFDSQLGKIYQIGDVYDKDVWLCRRYKSFDINMMLRTLYNTTKSLSNGYHIIPLDLSNYFTFGVYDKTDGKFHKVNKKADQITTIVNVAITKNKGKMVSYKQSLFKSVKHNSEWYLDGAKQSDYYKVLTEYNITAKDLTPSDTENGKFASISEECFNYLSSFNPKSIYINLTIDLDSAEFLNKGIILKGLNEDFARGLNIGSITIKSNSLVSFYVPSNIKNLNVYNVNLVYYGGDV